MPQRLPFADAQTNVLTHKLYKHTHFTLHTPKHTHTANTILLSIGPFKQRSYFIAPTIRLLIYTESSEAPVCAFRQHAGAPVAELWCFTQRLAPPRT